MKRIDPKMLHALGAVDSWRADAYDPAVDGDEFPARPAPANYDRTLPVFETENLRVYPRWLDTRNGWLINPDEWN